MKFNKSDKVVSEYKRGLKIGFMGDEIVVHKSCSVTLKIALNRELMT